ncbi:ComEC/Rec2 family competence protein [Paracoccus sp. KR1-242]|uniref:ComEC/Rec2 family competence protein n=1 Tax=Paracoccus sp. KR1-242 TaxID=3410028 RepID=UPI003C101526
MPKLGDSNTQGIGQGQVFVAVGVIDQGGTTARAGFLKSLGQQKSRASVAERAGLISWVPFWLSLGIGGWFSLRHEPGLGFYLGCGALGLGGLAIWRWPPNATGAVSWFDQLRFAGLALFFIALGALLSGLRTELVAAPVLEFRYYGGVEGRVVGIDRSSRDRLRLTLDQLAMDDIAPERVPRRVRISLIGTGQAIPVPGQRVMLTANLGPPGSPSEPGGFDFRRMAWFDGLGAIGYSRSPVLTVEPPQPGGALALHRLRMRLSAAIQTSIGGQAGAVSSALMTGDRSGIAEETNEIMRAANLYHIVSISGLHMSMLAGFVYASLRIIGAILQRARSRSGAHVHKWAAVGALGAAAAYLWLSGGDVATERSFVMVAVMLLAIVADRRAISLRTVSVAAIAILLTTPDALLAPGFQMSFVATVALILAHEPWLRVAPLLPWWLRPVLALLISSLVAGMATAPIAAAHFGRLSQYGTLANLLVVPVAGVLVMPAGVIAALVAPLGLQDIPLWVMGIGTKWMLLVARWIADLDGTTMLVPAPPRVVLPLIAIGASLALLAPVGARHGLLGNSRPRRWVGGMMLVAAFGIWLTAQRPLVLISAEGDAVGIMTPSVRATSKPKGGTFAVSGWLEADGDDRDQATAAATGPWQGEKGARHAQLSLSGGVVELVHLTGKRSAGLAAGLCHDGAMIVSNVRLDLPRKPRRDCLVLDPDSLRRSGAIAVIERGGRLHLVSVHDTVGDRVWTRPGTRR